MRRARHDPDLPHNTDAERSVLGAILVRPETLQSARLLLTPASFYATPNRLIFAAATRLQDRGSPVDILMLRAELERTGELDAAGGAAFLSSLVDAVPLSSNVEHYARLVAEKERDRAQVIAANALLHALMDRNGAGPGEGREAIDGAIAGLRPLLEVRHSTNIEPMDVKGLLAAGGWEPVWALEDFLIDRTFTWLSGPAKGFKTWLALHWAVALTTQKPFLRLTTQGDHRVLLIQAENRVQILQRLPRVCAAYGVTLNDVLERVTVCCPRHAIRLENPADAAELRALAKRLKATWVFIDSFRRVTAMNENDPAEMAQLADTGFLPLRDQGHGVLVLEHPSKPVAGLTRNRRESIRGTGEKLAAADVQLSIESIESPTGRVGSLSVAASRMGPERDEPLFLQLRDSESGAIEFNEVEEPETPRRGRKPSAVEQAINIIRAEQGRGFCKGFSEAVKAVRAAGMSRATAARAWKEVSGI